MPDHLGVSYEQVRKLSARICGKANVDSLDDLVRLIYRAATGMADLSELAAPPPGRAAERSAPQVWMIGEGCPAHEPAGPRSAPRAGLHATMSA
jgi:hypothetical protein